MRGRSLAGGVVAALALVVVFAFGLSWVFTTLGLVMRSPNKRFVARSRMNKVWASSPEKSRAKARYR